MNEKISKLVIKPSEVKDNRGFGLSYNENLFLCPDCKSPLMYIKIQYGIVAEDYEYMIQYNRGKRVYNLREIGLVIYCAECSDFIENYSKYFYPEDKLVFYNFDFDQLDRDERVEIEVCLQQFNQSGKFTPRYKSVIFTELKNKLIEYEKKHPLIKQKNKNNKRN